MSDFVTETLTGALDALEQRRRKLQQFINEADELDRAIKEQRKLLTRLGIEPGAPRVPKPEPPATAISPRPAAPVREGTNADRIRNLLRDHPRGLNTSVIARQSEIPLGSVGPVLNLLVERGHVTKVGRGFWRIAEQQDEAQDGPRLAAV